MVWTKEEIDFLEKNKDLLSSNRLGEVLKQIEKSDGWGMKSPSRPGYTKLDFLLRSHFGKEDTFWLRVFLDYYESVDRLNITFEFVGYGLEFGTWVTLFEDSYHIDIIPENLREDLFSDDNDKLRELLRELLCEGIYKKLMVKGLSSFPNKVRKILDDTFDKRLYVNFDIWEKGQGSRLLKRSFLEDDQSIIPYGKS